MDMSAAGLADLVADEGEVLHAYPDVVGVLTIGTGLTAASGVIVPKRGMTITKAESRRLLMLALDRNYEPAVQKRLGHVAQHVFDPSTSFHFNTGAIGRASWVAKFLKGDLAGAKASFLSWKNGGGRVIRGLELRRQREWETLSTGRYHNGAALVSRTETPDAVLDAAVERSVMKRGNRGADVRKLQQMLTEAGYPISLDGDFGFKTESAVKAFQRSHPNLIVDGRAGTATLTTLQRVIDLKRKAVTQPSAGGAAGTAAGTGGAVEQVDSAAGAIGWGLAAGVVVALIVLAFLAWRYRDEIKSMMRRK